MSVELVATKKSDSMVLDRFPAVISERAGSTVQLDNPLPGSYHCLVSLAGGC